MTKGEEIKLAKLEQFVKDIGKKLDTHVMEQRENFQIVFKKFDKLDSSFAGKWVEKVVIGSIISVVGGIITLMLYVY